MLRLLRLWWWDSEVKTLHESFGRGSTRRIIIAKVFMRDIVRTNN